MNELTTFENLELGMHIRTIVIDNEPWFVGKDVAEALEYINPRDAITRHIDDDDKKEILKSQFPTLEIPNRGLILINESGMYALILRSHLDSAKKFKRWITSEVIPSIRKNGGYIAGQETMTDDELLQKALIVAQRKIDEKNRIIEEKNAQIEESKPKVIFADAVATSKTSILIGDLAKLICQNGFEIGQKRLFDWMREHGYLCKSGTSRNLPMQRYVEQGLFEIKESNIQNPDGSVRITKTTKVTGKGQVYFINKFLCEV